MVYRLTCNFIALFSAFVVAAMLILPVVAVPARASANYPEPGELRDKPVLFPANDTYYELVYVHSQYPSRFPRTGLRHRQANNLAYTRTYRGRSGRLAIVDSPEINNFLLATFRPSDIVWIGLRYWCEYHRGIWSSGESYKLTGYSNWASPWNTDGSYRFADKNGNTPGNTNCAKGHAWGVHYWSVKDGFQWNANGWQKHSVLFFVEYPPVKDGADEDKPDEKAGNTGDNVDGKTEPAVSDRKPQSD